MFYFFPSLFFPPLISRKYSCVPCGVAKLYRAVVNVGVGYDGVGNGSVHLLVLQSSTGLTQDWGGAKAKVCQALDLILRY